MNVRNLSRISGLKSLCKLIFQQLSLIIISGAIYLAAIYATNGYASGMMAAILAVIIVLFIFILVVKKIKKNASFPSYVITLIFILGLIIYSLKPVVEVNNMIIPSDFEDVSTQYWELPTGSQIAYYKLEASADSNKKETPIIFLHGGPAASIRNIDLSFFRKFTNLGYDVYLYDQAGSGRSGLLKADEYSHKRNLSDLNAILDAIGSEKFIVIGESYGCLLLAHLTASTKGQMRVAKAIYCEPTHIVKYKEDETYKFAKSRHLIAKATPLPLRIRLSKLLKNTEFVPQNESNAYFYKNGSFTKELFRENFPIADSIRVPMIEASIFNITANARILKDASNYLSKQQLISGFNKNKVPSLLLIGESSYIERNAPMNLLMMNKNIVRTHYFKGVGHLLWNGLDYNNEKVGSAIESFLNDQPSTIPNFPTRKTIPQFYRNRF